MFGMCSCIMAEEKRLLFAWSKLFIQTVLWNRSLVKKNICTSSLASMSCCLSPLFSFMESQSCMLTCLWTQTTNNLSSYDHFCCFTGCLLEGNSRPEGLCWMGNVWKWLLWWWVKLEYNIKWKGSSFVFLRITWSTEVHRRTVYFSIFVMLFIYSVLLGFWEKY